MCVQCTCTWWLMMLQCSEFYTWHWQWLHSCWWHGVAPRVPRPSSLRVLVMQCIQHCGTRRVWVTRLAHVLAGTNCPMPNAYAAVLATERGVLHCVCRPTWNNEANWQATASNIITISERTNNFEPQRCDHFWPCEHWFTTVQLNCRFCRPCMIILRDPWLLMPLHQAMWPESSKRVGMKTWLSIGH